MSPQEIEEGARVIGAGTVVGGNVWLTRFIPTGTKVQVEPPYLIYREANGKRPPKKEALDNQI